MKEAALQCLTVRNITERQSADDLYFHIIKCEWSEYTELNGLLDMDVSVQVSN